MKEFVIDKKRSIILSIMIPIIISLLMVIILNFIPRIEFDYTNIIKPTMFLVPIISLVLSVSLFWGVLFLAKSKFKKTQININRNKAVLYSIILPIIIFIFLLIILIIPSSDKALIFNLEFYLKEILEIVISISLVISYIEFWMILFSSLKIYKKKLN